MSKIVAALPLASLIAGVVVAGSTIGVRGDEGSIAKGARIVALGNGHGAPACASCHTISGVGDPSGAFPRLTGQPAHYLWHALTTFADGERRNAVMTPIAIALSEDERKDVAAYYATQSAPVPIFPPLDPKLVEEGRTIAAVGLNDEQIPACAACHGPAGRTVNPTVPSLAAQYSAYVGYALSMFKQDYRKNDQMNGIAQRLTPEQVRALSQYFQQVEAKPSGTPVLADLPGIGSPKP